jgi:hypothetical protein
MKRLINHSGLPTKRALAHLSGVPTVKIKWGNSELIVEESRVNTVRKHVLECHSDVSPEDRGAAREAIRLRIEQNFPELSRPNPRKSAMDALMSDLVWWHVLGPDA